MGASDFSQLCSRAAARFSPLPGRGATEAANIPLRGRGGPSAPCAAAHTRTRGEVNEARGGVCLGQR